MILSIRDDLITSKEVTFLLSQLTDAPDLSDSHFSQLIRDLQPNQEIFVYKINEILVGMTSVFIEQKIIHGGKCVAHIEDVVVDHRFRGQGIATKLLNHAIRYGEKHNCYKILLNCSDDVKPFYEKCHFKKKSHGMAYYLYES